MAMKTKQSYLKTLEEKSPQQVGSGSCNTGFPIPTGVPTAATPTASSASLSRSETRSGFQLDATSELLQKAALDDKILKLAQQMYEANPAPKPKWDDLRPGMTGTRGVWIGIAREILENHGPRESGSSTVKGINMSNSLELPDEILDRLF